MLLHRMTSVMGWPFCIIYLAIILITVYITVITIPKSFKHRHWQTKQAEVIETKILERTRINRLSQRITTYSARINYKYQIDGQTYCGSFKQWAERSQKTIAQRIQQHFPTGSTVLIYFNPQDLSESIKQPGVTSGQYFALALLIILLLTMTVIIFNSHE